MKIVKLGGNHSETNKAGNFVSFTNDLSHLTGVAVSELRQSVDYTLFEHGVVEVPGAIKIGLALCQAFEFDPPLVARYSQVDDGFQ